MKNKFLSFFMLIIVAFCGVLFIACDKKQDDTINIPEYQGMVLSNSINQQLAVTGKGNNGNHFNPGLNAGLHNGHTSNNKPSIDQNDPFGNSNQIENNVDKLVVNGADKDIYYATVGQDAYITIKLSNPDQYEILSFTLNEKKYSSYMFEPGSDLENLILKVNVGEVAGLKDYTIDAIKYVDGDEIKDVSMKGDKTITVGIKLDSVDMVRASVTNEVINLNSIAFNVNIVDEYKLIEFSNGGLVAVLYDGDTIVSRKSVNIGNNNIKFANLNSGTIYQYAIIGYFDDFSGKGAQNYVLYKNSVQTDRFVEFDNIEITYNSVSWEYLWNNTLSNSQKSIISQELYLGVEKVGEYNGTQINNLLSNGVYTIIARESLLVFNILIHYRQQFTTDYLPAPTFTITAENISTDSIDFNVNMDDSYDLGSYVLEVYKDDNQEMVYQSATLTDKTFNVTVNNLLTNTKYVGTVRYSYDLQDGQGVVTDTETITIYTLLSTPPTATIKNIVVDGQSVTFEVKIDDQLNILNTCNVSIRSYTGAVSNLRSYNDYYTMHGLEDGKYQLRATLKYYERGNLISYTYVKNIEIGNSSIMLLNCDRADNGAGPYTEDVLGIRINLEYPEHEGMALIGFMINDKYYAEINIEECIYGIPGEGNTQSQFVAYFEPYDESDDTTFTITGLVYDDMTQVLSPAEQISFSICIW